MSPFLPVRLDGDADTIVFASVDGGPLAIAYWGRRLPTDVDLTQVAAGTLRPVPHGLLDCGEVLDLMPDGGRGFTGRPAVSVTFADGRSILQLKLARLEVQPDHLGALLVDEGGVHIWQEISLHRTGVATFSARVACAGELSITVNRFVPAALVIPYSEVLRFGGRWTNEFQTERLQLGLGGIVSENRTGRTSHHAPPFVIVGEAGFGEDHGVVLGAHLGWSGDSEVLVERVRDGRVQIQLGATLAPSEVNLEAGQSYQAPPLYAARSEAGLNGFSDRMHRFVRAAILPQRMKHRPRMVHFNTWEAMYFDHDQDRLKALAGVAAEVGVERFVLDDGWFLGRRSDAAGLGDWVADPVIYPQGLRPLADHVRALGMSFGLWVEPESVNPNSRLYEAHPDWVRGEAGRLQPMGRGQLILDLTILEAQEAIFRQIDAALRGSGADYLKWDFNRDTSHATSDGRPCGVAQMRAVYDLIDRLRAAHPNLEIEACASGGARADFGMLSRCERIWVSDCNDPFDRQRQQRAFGLFFPPEVMGAHVGPKISHTTGRITRLDTRALTAMFGHFGVEADLTALSAKELEALRGYVSFYKSIRAEAHHGRLRRLEHSDVAVVAFSVETPNGQLISVAQCDTAAFSVPDTLRLTGLVADKIYAVSLLTPLRHPEFSMKSPPDWVRGAERRLPGAVLMDGGLVLPVLRPGDVLVFRAETVG